MSMMRLRQTEVSLESQLLPTTSAPAVMGDDVRDFAQTLSVIHGSLRVATESSGLHFYIPCPSCLENNGESEIHKKHLAINVDKFMRGGKYSSCCMKCGYTCETAELQYMQPLSERGIEYKPEILSVAVAKPDYVETDAYGRLVPKSPGKVIPIHELPSDNPAIQYLKTRQFAPLPLWEQFQCSWCEEENPSLFYRRLSGGFKVTSQGRLIFFCLQNGSKVGWQARILEFDEGDPDGEWRSFWHPYKKEWVQVLARSNSNEKWTARDGYEDWDPAKYWTSPGMLRSQVVMGFDAAVEWNSRNGHDTRDERRCVLVEGPLDAGRLGSPALAIMGKFLSAGQAELVANTFGRVVIVGDNDEAGEKMRESVTRQLMSKNVRFQFFNLPDRYKDAGSLDAAGVLFYNRKIMEMLCQS
jgi:hypothetical protein